MGDLNVSIYLNINEVSYWLPYEGNNYFISYITNDRVASCH